jgi:exopolysaccharide biosynthesis protein
MLVLITAIAVALGYASKSRTADVNLKVVEIDPNQGIEIRPVISLGKQETFTGMMDRLHPYAAINGTYYDHDWKPLGDILIDGKLVNRGTQRNAVAITKSGKINFIRRKGKHFNWSGYWMGLAAGPRLIHKGKIALDPVADGFSRHSLEIKAWRSGIGKTAKGKLLLVTAQESLTLLQFARKMRNLGSIEAMNLDGGGACALYHKGNYLAIPTLRMTNLLVVYKKSK